MDSKRFVSLPTALPWFIAIVLHAVAANYSAFYHHPDEHYSIWEFANFLAGNAPDASGLPWEFSAKIRPLLQPFLHVLLIKFSLWLRFFNPISVSLIARELYAAANLGALYSLWKVFKKNLGSDFPAQACAWVIATLWFLPYVHCRSSSENLAGIFLTLAFAQFYRIMPQNSSPYSIEKKSTSLKSVPYLWLGILFGLSFTARYQVAVGLAGLAAYWLMQERRFKLPHLYCLIGFMVAAAFGLGVDRIGYGEWVLTPYRYFHVNLIQGVALTFSPHPWYQYFVWMLELHPVVSVPLLIGIWGYFKKFRIDPLLAFSSVFFAFHCFISNKEYRFLFPLFNFLPIIAVLGWKRFWSKAWVVVNLPALAWCSFTLPNLGFWPLLMMHHYSISDAPHNESTPQQRWLVHHHGPTIPFYSLPPFITQKSFDTYEELNADFQELKKPLWVLWSGNPSAEHFDDILNFLNRSCERKSTSIPYFIFEFRNRYPAIQRFHFQAIFNCPNNPVLNSLGSQDN